MALIAINRPSGIWHRSVSGASKISAHFLGRRLYLGLFLVVLFRVDEGGFPPNEISLTEEGSPRLCSSSVYQFLVPRYSFSCNAWAMTAYRVTRRPFRSQPLKPIGLLDVEGSQTCFSAMDVRKISLHLFARHPYPEIIIEVHFYQDSNQRNHDGAPDYMNENGTKFWVFPFRD